MRGLRPERLEFAVKIAYLVRVRPDLEEMIPADVEHVVAQVGDDGLYDDAALARVADAEAFVIGMEPVNEQLLAATPKVKIAQRLGVGYETMDLEATARRGVCGSTTARRSARTGW